MIGTLATRRVHWAWTAIGGFLCIVILSFLLPPAQARGDEPGGGAVNPAPVAATATPTPAPATPPTPVAPKHGGVVNLALDADPGALGWHPYAAPGAPVRTAVLTLAHSRLARYHYGPRADTHDFTASPDLAEGWAVSSDGLQWTFKLRPSVAFHDGSPATAKDAVASVAAALDSGWALPASLKDLVASVDAPGENTVVLKLNAPHWGLAHLMASPSVPIMPAADAQAKSLAAPGPGAGPFVFKEAVKDASLTFARNPSYWAKDAPYLDGAQFFIIADPATRQAAFLAGRLSVSGAAPSFLLLPEPWQDTQAKMGAKIHARPWPATTPWALWFVAGKPPFNDARVRMAVGQAISEEIILKELYRGAGALEGPVPHSVLGKGPAEPQHLLMNGFAPDEAKKLLVEAGYPNGLQAQLLVPAIDNRPDGAALAEVAAKFLAQVGIKASIEIKDPAVFLADLQGQPAGSLYLFPFANAWYEPATFLQAHYGPGAAPPYAPSAVAGSSAPDLVKAFMTTGDPAKRLEIRAQITRELDSKAWVGAMPAALPVTAWQATLRNFSPHAGPDLGPILERAWFGEGMPPVAGADLAVSKTAGVATANAGDIVTYRVTVSNRGPADAANVVLVESLPPGVRSVSTSVPCVAPPVAGPGASDAPATATPQPAANAAPGANPAPTGKLVCNLGTIPNGGKVSLEIKVQFGPVSGVVTNGVSVSSSVPDPDTSNNAARASVTVGNQSVVVGPAVAPSVRAGSTFSVVIQASHVENLAGAQVTLTFDPAVVQLQEIKAAGPLASCFSDSNTGTPGVAALIIACGPPAAHSGAPLPLWDLTFMAARMTAPTPVVLTTTRVVLADSQAPAQSIPAVGQAVRIAVVQAGVCGDLDGDGDVNVKDVIAALQIAVGRMAANENHAFVGDLNGDGVINVLDAIRGLQRVVGLVKATDCGPALGSPPRPVPMPMPPPAATPTLVPTATPRPAVTPTSTPTASPNMS